MSKRNEMPRDSREPEDLQDDGRTLAADERPVMEELGEGEADTEEHSG
jgi:hypothetical protein